jgi:trigger factor
MSVVVSVADVGPCRKQLKVEVPAPAVEAETQRVVREYGQRVRIPCFRKGRVPAELVRRRFQKDIEKEVVERLLPRYWHQAQEESAIEPLLPPEVDEVEDLAPGAPLTFVATVETRPQIELKNIRDFDLPDPSVDPGTMEIDDTLDDLRKQLSRWVPVERPAARGDLVAGEVVELSAAPSTAEDEPGREPQHVEVEVGDPRVWEELSLALSGLATGQEANFTHRDGSDTEDGPERHFRVKVESVQERELPPLDDELAGKVGPFASVDALREAVVERLRAGKVQGRHEQRQKAVLDQLRERHPIELPQGVVRHEIEHLVQDYAQSLADRGVKLDQAGIDWDRVAEEMRPLAEKRVHARLLLDAVSEADGISLSEEEFEAALAGLARAQGTSTSALRRSLDEKGRLAGFRAQLRRDKTIRRLLGEEEILEMPEAQPAEVADADVNP